MDPVDDDGFFVRFILLRYLFFDASHSKKGPIQLLEDSTFPTWIRAQLLRIYFMHTPIHILFSGAL